MRRANERLEWRVRERTAELEQASLASRESEERFRMMVDGVTDYAILTLDLSGHVTSWNPGAERLKGYRAEEIIGQYFSCFYPEEDVARGKPAMELEQAAASGRSEDEGWQVRKDGSRFWANGIITALRDESGRVRGFVKITRDMTERQRAAEDIHALNADLEGRVQERAAQLAQFKAALDEHAIVAITDARGKITYVNDKFCAISQYAREELIGHDHRIINSGHHPKAFIRDLWQTIGSGRVWKGEIRNRAKDGTFYWVATTIVPFLDEHGKPLQYIAIRTDITERKQAEERVSRLNADLQIGSAQLVEANKELESFSYSVSHDLRAPLRHVHGYIEMLKRDAASQLSEKGQRYVKTITEASAEMGQLIDDLLAFSRTNRAEMRESSVDLNALVKDTIQGMEMSTMGRNITWQVAPLPAVVGDSAMIKQALANLVDNAVKYTRQRDPARIEIGSAGDEDGRTVLFVRDNGAGFDMKYVHKLFGVFQRLHRPEDFEGTGIGLATVRRIVARHGGRVWAEGAIEQGATFFFTLKQSPSA
ncbi:MAG: hypothetical protein A3J29_22500 [Acidobacteria bacterium RIFCSPLOWO2_12_FULL_67_14b]|nr:MAG: hypothetical protein A3J29_22500 [Acidobacteria bacterium RIFCSPLOWO2_12_FULL_67_14b]